MTLEQAVNCMLPAGQGALNPAVFVRAGFSSFSAANPVIAYASPQVRFA